MPLYFHPNWMKQHSEHRRAFPEGYVRRRAGHFTTFSLGSGNEALSCSDHDAKLSSSRAGDSPWRGSPRQQLAWHQTTAAASQVEVRAVWGFIHAFAHVCLCMRVYVIICVSPQLLYRLVEGSGSLLVRLHLDFTIRIKAYFSSISGQPSEVDAINSPSTPWIDKRNTAD